MNSVQGLRAKGFIRLILVSVVLSALGGWLIFTGMSGLVSGEILVYGKHHPAYIASSLGPHVTDFYFTVGLYLISGAVILPVGIGCLMILLFARGQKREKALFAAASADVSLSRSKLRVPLWFAVVVLTSLILVLVYGATK